VIPGNEKGSAGYNISADDYEKTADDTMAKTTRKA
jgi:hypothetical protein